MATTTLAVGGSDVTVGGDTITFSTTAGVDVAAQSAFVALMPTPGVAISGQAAFVALMPSGITSVVGTASASATASGAGQSNITRSTAGAASASASASGSLTSYRRAGAGTAVASATAAGTITSSTTIARGIASAVSSVVGAARAIRNVGAGTATAKATALGGANFIATISAGRSASVATALGVMTARLPNGGTLWGVQASEVINLQTSTVRRTGLRVAITEALSAHTTLTGFVSISIRDSLRFTLQQTLNRRLQATASAGISLKDSFLRTLRGVLIDTVRLTLTHQEKLVLQLLDQIGVLSALSTKATYLRTVHDAARFQSYLLRALGAAVSDHVSLSSTGLVKLMALIGLHDGVALTTAASPTWMLTAVVKDGVDIDAMLEAQARFHLGIFDEIGVLGGMLDANGDLSVWSMNTRTAAVTQFDNYPFNSFAKLAPQRYIGGADDGLYELLGDDDAGQGVIATLRSGYLQFGGTHLSRLKEAYIAIRGTGEFVLKILTADGEEYVYQSPLLSMTSNKIHMGKGQRARYFAFELVSSGQDFDLDTIEFVPIVVKRRI